MINKAGNIFSMNIFLFLTLSKDEYLRVYANIYECMYDSLNFYARINKNQRILSVHLDFTMENFIVKIIKKIFQLVFNYSNYKTCGTRQGMLTNKFLGIGSWKR